MYMSGSAVRFDAINGPLQSLTKVSYDTDTKETKEVNWYPGRRRFVGEPLFVAREGSTSEDDGWIVVLVHDGGEVLTKRDGSEESDGGIVCRDVERDWRFWMRRTLKQDLWR